MGYRLNPQSALGVEIARVYRGQLSAAIAALAGDAPVSVHAARKHVKKARALLLRADEGGSIDPDAEHELKIANRAVGALSDAHRIVEASELLKGFNRARVPDTLWMQLHAALVARRATVLVGAGASTWRERAARLIASARARADKWETVSVDDAAIASTVACVHRQSQHAARHARRRPTVAAYHHWRRSVKVEWYWHRLIADHTGGRLSDDQHRLAALDACLGTLHDLHVLAGVVADEQLLDRHDRARVLASLRELIRDLRRKAWLLADVLRDRPHDVKRRVRALWGMPALPARREERWPNVA